jgi:hypothetical protein
MYRNRRKLDLAAYREYTTEGLSALPISQIQSVNEIEEKVSKVTEVLRQGFYKACPLKKTKTRSKTKSYWSPELTHLRAEARRLGRQVNSATRLPVEAWNTYAEARKAFKRALRQAKRAAYKAYCTSIETYSDASRAYKIIAGDKCVRLGPMELPNGS